jgi:hypothetical protein
VKYNVLTRGLPALTFLSERLPSSSAPSRMRLLEELLKDKGGLWFARGCEIAAYTRSHPGAQPELDLDVTKMPAAF